jgi:hypothetical protein
MCDDICAVTFPDGGPPMASWGSVGLRLWPDSRSALRCGGPEWLPIRQGHAKQVGPAAAAEPRRRLPLRAVIRIVATGSSEPSLRRLHGPAAASPMGDLVYHLPAGRALGRREALFRDTMRLAASAPIFELRRPIGFERLERMADAVLSAVECPL